MTSRLASVTFKMASKVLIEEKDKNFDFITKYCSDFLDCEMSSGIMNFKDSFLSVEQILRAIIPTGHTFEGQYTARLRS